MKSISALTSELTTSLTLGFDGEPDVGRINMPAESEDMKKMRWMVVIWREVDGKGSFVILG